METRDIARCVSRATQRHTIRAEPTTQFAVTSDWDAPGCCAASDADGSRDVPFPSLFEARWCTRPLSYRRAHKAHLPSLLEYVGRPLQVNGTPAGAEPARARVLVSPKLPQYELYKLGQPTRTNWLQSVTAPEAPAMARARPRARLTSFLIFEFC